MIELHIENLYCRVNKKKATKEELNALSDVLSIKVPGYFFSKKWKEGLWDGRRRFFNRLTGTFYAGLIGFAERRLPNFEIAEIDERVQVLSKRQPLNLIGTQYRSYQSRMLLEAMAYPRGIIAGATNSGKTEVACGMIQVLGLPANFLTHRKTLLHQTRKRFEHRLGRKGGILGGGYDEIQDINILSVPSLSGR